MDWNGIIAATWDCLGGDEPGPDIPYLQEILRRQGGPALDVACGTGRVLLRCLAAGLEVEGVDLSADMLARCREKAQEQGLAPTLYRQAMQRLTLRRTYRTLFVTCGSFQMVTDPADAQCALERFYDHLEPGGRLILTARSPFAPGEPLSGDRLPEWQVKTSRTCPDDGSVVRLQVLTEALDPVDQLLVERRLYEVLRDDAVVREECVCKQQRWYYRHQLTHMLEAAGFTGVEGYGDFTNGPATDESVMWVFTATRNGERRGP